MEKAATESRLSNCSRPPEFGADPVAVAGFDLAWVRDFSIHPQLLAKIRLGATTSSQPSGAGCGTFMSVTSQMGRIER
jgi:hypothetical protein